MKRSADRGEIRGVSPQFAGSRCERLTLIVLVNSFKVSTATNRSRKPVVVAGSLLQGTGHEFL